MKFADYLPPVAYSAVSVACFLTGLLTILTGGSWIAATVALAAGCAALAVALRP